MDNVQYLTKSRKGLITAVFDKNQVKQVTIVDLEMGLTVFGNGAVYLEEVVEQTSARQVIYVPDTTSFVFLDDLDLGDEQQPEAEEGCDIDYLLGD